MSKECGAVKHGAIDLRCALEPGHDETSEDRPATWHWATVINRGEVDYPGAHHEIEHTETVTWEPVDHAEEAVRHMLAASKRHAAPLPAEAGGCECGSPACRRGPAPAIADADL